MPRPAIHPPGTRGLQARYAVMKHRAKRRGRVVTLTFEEYRAFVGRPCHYCGGVTGLGELAGIDRLDSDGDYTPENVVPACAACNMWKSTMTTEAFRTHLERLYRRFVLGQAVEDGYVPPPMQARWAEMYEERRRAVRAV